MRIYLETLGCRLNYAETAALSRQLVEAGHDLSPTAELADLCVLNSCAVTMEAARKSRQLARQVARANPGGRLILAGCYATLETRAAGELPNVTLVVENRRKDDLFALIDGLARQDKNASKKPAVSHASLPVNRTRAFVKVQDGCRNRCAFCVVTLARGEERSRPVEEIVAEINALHVLGFQEVVLAGVHLGGYGSDLGSNLTSLVRTVIAETDVPRVRLSSLEPFDLAPGFFELWGSSSGRLMPHLHLPLQSGSDRVLRRMARRNSVAEYEALVSTARDAIPGLTVTTDLIAGFPGETEEDFAETVALAHRMGFAHLHVFTYSERPGTAAASLTGMIPRAERKRRSRILGELDRVLARQVRVRSLADLRSVLWEGRERAGMPRGIPGVVWSGLTDNYLRVCTVAPEGIDLHNRITQVRLVRLEGDTLWGECEEGLP